MVCHPRMTTSHGRNITFLPGLPVTNGRPISEHVRAVPLILMIPDTLDEEAMVQVGSAVDSASTAN